MSSEDQPRSFDTTREWMLVCDAKGIALYWVAADGERRAPDDQPPRGEWSKEMHLTRFVDHGR